MKALFFILNKEELLEEVLETFLELNISGATIIDSVGMGAIVTRDIPIFAGFKNLMEGSRPGNKTIITLIPDEIVETTIKAIEQVVGSLEEPGNGVAFVLPLDAVYGITKSF